MKQTETLFMNVIFKYNLMKARHFANNIMCYGGPILCVFICVWKFWLRFSNYVIEGFSCYTYLSVVFVAIKLKSFFIFGWLMDKENIGSSRVFIFYKQTIASGIDGDAMGQFEFLERERDKLKVI